MKTRSSKLVRFLSLLCLAVWAIASRAAAQTPPVLDVHLYAGLTITGAVGTVYSVEYVTDLAQTNTPSAWRSLEYLQLPASPYLWADKSAPATGKRFYRAVAMEAPTNLVFIPPGTFMMGSPSTEEGRWDNEGPQTQVHLSKGFFMGKFEVTQEEYLAIAGRNPFVSSGQLKLPVERVSWNDATRYCRNLTQRELDAGRLQSGASYRLPTEAEWEYACRAGTATRFSYGDDPDYVSLGNYAWYSRTDGGGTHPVGQKLPNPWGLYDMHGNVWEWCQDWYWRWLPGGSRTNWTGPDRGENRVVRGGRFLNNAKDCRSAFRRGLDYRHPTPPMIFHAPKSGQRDGSFGFRVVLAPGQP